MTDASQNKGRIVLGEGRFLSLLSVNGWEFTERHAATHVVSIWAVNSDRELVLTDQFRQSIETNVIDLPAGLCGDLPEASDEPFAVAAERELLEETGYAAESLREVMTFPTSPGMANEKVTLFEASGLKRVEEGGGDDSEQIEVIHVPLDDLRATLNEWTASGLTVDPKLMAAAYLCGAP